MSKYKQQVNREIVKRGLVSVMNNTKWNELRDSVCRELPFTPPYQNISYQKDGDTILIYGYASHTGNLLKGGEL